MNLLITMRRDVKFRNPIIQRRRINEQYDKENWFYTTTSYDGYNFAHIFMAKGQRLSHIMDWQLNQMDKNNN